MKPIVLQFIGGYWDGKNLRTDSADQEESLLAAACYERSHHGTIGAECSGLSGDAVTFASLHGWTAAAEGSLQGSHRYVVTERRDTADAVVVTFRHTPLAQFARTTGQDSERPSVEDVPSNH
jgi:hypothetical protein